MGKKGLVLMGSPQINGNCDHLSDEFIRGAAESGCVIENFFIDKHIQDCIGCCACQRNGGACVQNDEMQEIYEKMKQADVIVFAAPVYFYTWNSLIKRVLDRTIAVTPALTHKTFFLLSAGLVPTEDYMTTMIDSFRKYIGCFRGEDNQEGGYVFAYGVDRPGDVVGTPAMEQAYQMGKRV